MNREHPGGASRAETGEPRPALAAEPDAGPGEAPMGTTSVPTRTRLQPVSRTELVVAWFALAILAAVTFGPYARSGGFTLDDWSNASGALYSGGFGGSLDYFVDITQYRPGLVIYVPLTYEILGSHMGLHLAWATAIAVAVSGLVYAILRTLGLARLHAGLVSALVLLFPWADSTRLWATGSQVTLGVTLALIGLWLALTGLRKGRWGFHVAAVVLYATSILTYEIALPLIASAGLLYIAVAGWRAAWKRWAADIAVALAGAAWVLSQTARESKGIDQTLEHLKTIVVEGGKLLGSSALPLSTGRTALALVALLVIGLVGVVVLRWDRSRSTAPGTSVLPWLLMAVGGLAVTALGWAMFVPADPYYTPTIFGVTNRVNGLAAIGLVLVVYAALGIIGALAGRVSDRPGRAASVVTVVLALALGVSYKAVVERHADIWVTAFDAQMAGAAQLKAEYPSLPDGTTVFVSGYPLNQTLGVPIYSASWDLNGLVQMQYKKRTVGAMPVFPDTRLRCYPTGVALEGPGYRGGLVPYGRARFFEVTTRRSAVPRNVRSCRRAAPTFVAGPLYLDYRY